MKISLSWLRDFVPTDLPAGDVADLLTSVGLEVEGIEERPALPGGLAGLVVGRVLSLRPHPNADRLRVCEVDCGQPGDPRQIVCGAANVAEGQAVVVALPGAMLYPSAGEPFEIKKSKIRGEESLGMICAEDEIGLGTGHDGILVLDTDLAPGTPAAQALGLETDHILEIGLTPNRGDAASHLGVARDLAAKLGLPVSRLVAALPEASMVSDIEVAIKAQAECPVYAAMLIEGVQVGPSPEWMQRRLVGIGLVPINNVVDATNYILHHLGQPMHAFDADKLKGTLRVAVLEGPATLITLDKVARTLAAGDLVIADDRGPIALAGVMGGLDTAVTDHTTRVLLESACFLPKAVRRTATRHGIKTDASFRFERGTDPALPLQALAEAAALPVFAQARIGAVVQAVGEVFPAGGAVQVRMEYDRLIGLIGHPITQVEVDGFLTGLGFSILSIAEGVAEVSAPTWRSHDVEGLADLAEEVVRMYGLNNLTLPERTSVSFYDTTYGWHELDAQDRAARSLAGQGYVEIVTNSITRTGQAEGLEAGIVPVDLLNPLSEELTQMRLNPLEAGLEALAYNQKRQAKSLRLFEFGKSYGKEASGAYTEKAWLCLYAAGQAEEESWQARPRPVRYADLAAALAATLSGLGVALRTEPLPAGHALFAEGVQYLAKNKVVGYGGLVSPALARRHDLRGAAYALCIEWAALARASQPKPFMAVPPPKFPEVRRDLSLVVDRAVSFAQLETLARATERKLLQEVSLFDVFEGASLGEGKKAYALAFTLSDPAATLTDSQIDQTMTRLEAALVAGAGAVVRR